jgi:HD superfamily phosphodiesterase
MEADLFKDYPASPYLAQSIWLSDDTEDIAAKSNADTAPASTVAPIISIDPRFIRFALDTIAEYQMDDSHGLTHFINVTKYASIILNEYRCREIIPGLTKAAETTLILDAAFVHDLIDKKYMDEAEGVARLRQFLDSIDYHPGHINYIITIITSMSFSKRHARMIAGLPAIEPGPVALATAIVADADQLDAYDLRRIVAFQYSAHGRSVTSTQERRNWIKTIIVNRVLLYRDKYMSTEIARRLAAPLHETAAAFTAREMPDDLLMNYP